MLKVYLHCLSNIVIIDTEKNKMLFTGLHEVVKGKTDYEPEQRITKATVNKHKKRGYGISVPILANYAPEELRKYEAQDADDHFIGEYPDMETFSKVVKSLYEQSKEVRTTRFFVNFASDLWKTMIALRQGKTEQEFNKYNNKTESDLMLFRCLEGKV